MRQVPREQGVVTSLLWEADPQRFTDRYPDSGIVESYGDGWPGVHCIDYWVYVEAEARQARLSVEGWNPGYPIVPLSGDGRRDGLAIAVVMAEILRVPPPGA